MDTTDIITLDLDAAYVHNGFNWTPILVSGVLVGAVRDNGNGRFTAFRWIEFRGEMIELDAHDSVLSGMANLMEELDNAVRVEDAYRASCAAYRADRIARGL
jgi:hypothetical protein